MVLSRLAISRASAPRSALVTASDFDFAWITEDWDIPANVEQREMSYVRHDIVRRRVQTSRLLDLGCGTAYGLVHTFPGADPAAAVDVNWENMWSTRRHLPNGQFVQATVDAFPFREGSRNTVPCLEATSHFDDQVESFRQIGRVVRSSGRLLMTMPDPQRAGFIPSAGAHALLSATALSDMLRMCGFEPQILIAFQCDEHKSLGRDRGTRTRTHRNNQGDAGFTGGSRCAEDIGVRQLGTFGAFRPSRRPGLDP